MNEETWRRVTEEKIYFKFIIVEAAGYHTCYAVRPDNPHGGCALLRMSKLRFSEWSVLPLVARCAVIESGFEHRPLRLENLAVFHSTVWVVEVLREGNLWVQKRRKE